MTEAPSPAKKSSAAKITIFIIVFIAAAVIIAAAITAVIFLTTAGLPTTQAEKFVKAVSQNKIDAAYELTSSDFQKVVSKDTLSSFIQTFPIIVDYKKLNLSCRGTEKSAGKELAYASGKLVGKSGETSSITINLIKEQDQWKVLNFSLKDDDVPKACK